MSLKISNRATDKQIEMLKKLDYYGKWNLTTEEAAQLIDELLEEKRINQDQSTDDWYLQ